MHPALLIPKLQRGLPPNCPYTTFYNSSRDEPPEADRAPARSSNRWAPSQHHAPAALSSPSGKALYKLHKQTVEPVIGQTKTASGFRQFLGRGLTAAQAGWTLACTAHNPLKLHKALTLT